jgi:hypothetical protein
MKEPELPPIKTDGLPPRVLPEPRTGCSVPGCDEPHYARTCCKHHYRVAYYRANSARSIALNRKWRQAKGQQS